MALLAINATAYDFMVDGIAYNYLNGSAGSEVEVTGNWHNYINYSGLTIASIPSTVTNSGRTYSVTSIGKFAFSECKSLASVIIGNSVTSIGADAFWYCSGLTSVTIGNSVTSIGPYAFQYCSGLTEVTIPNSVTTISDGTFRECHNLRSVTLGNSVTSIGGSAFYECNKLTEITIPRTVTLIGDYAFSFCSSLPRLTIPNSVTSIGECAFQSCTHLTTVTIPNSVTSIGRVAFGTCSGLESIKVESGNLKYDSRNDCNAIIETALNTLIAGCKKTTIPNSVTTIGDGAFWGISLTSLTIPNSVTEIKSNAFASCKSLTSILIPSSVTSIKKDAFYRCLVLNEIKCRIYDVDNVSMGDDVFYEVPLTCVLKVPIGTANAYRQAAQWNRFKNIIEEESAINDVVEDVDVVVVARDGCLVVDGAGDLPVEIVDMAGRMVYSGAADAIPSLQHDVYIIHVNGKSFKVKI